MGNADPRYEGLAGLLGQLQKTHDSRLLPLIVKRAIPYVFSISYLIMRNRHAAEDVTQEVFVKLTQKFDRIREPGKLLVWLRIVTISQANLARRRAGEPTLSDLSIDTTTLMSRREKLPLEGLMEEEEKAKLEKQLDTALKKLSPAERRCLELSYWGNLKAPDVAKRMGIKLATVYRYHSIALKKLFSMKCLEE